MRRLPLLASLAVGSAFAVPAAYAQAPVRVAAASEAAVSDARRDRDADASIREGDVRDRTCLRQTGSLIRPTGKGPRGECTSANGRAYTRDDIQRTGQTDIGQALRMLDPSIR